jgi:hypothetical protein
MSVFFVKSEFVESFSIEGGVIREGIWLCVGSGFACGPPELGTVEIIGNFFIVVHAKDKGVLAVFDNFSFEAFGKLRGIFAKVSLDGRVCLTPFESFPREFGKSDLNVRVEKVGEFLSVNLKSVTECWREETLNQGV